MSPEDYKVARENFPDTTLVDYSNYRLTYDAVVNGECEAAILPFEKSYAGEIGQIMNMLFEGDLVIKRVISNDNGTDVTRYAILGLEENTADQVSDDSHFMLMFTVTDEAGCLAAAIDAISSFGFNMCTLRSRHMKDLPWNYYFLVEAIGNYTTETGQRMLATLGEACQTVKKLGCFNV